jgi:hypothetical protein
VTELRVYNHAFTLLPLFQLQQVGPAMIKAGAAAKDLFATMQIAFRNLISGGLNDHGA